MCFSVGVFFFVRVGFYVVIWGDESGFIVGEDFCYLKIEMILEIKCDF